MKTNMQKTSLLAYFSHYKKLQEREKDVIRVFTENPHRDFTNKEILDELRIEEPRLDICSVTGRVQRLRGEGKGSPYRDCPLLVECVKRPCGITGNQAIAWQLNPNI